MANVGGLGGGMIKVPLLMLILNYGTIKSAAITYPILFGGKI